MKIFIVILIISVLNLSFAPMERKFCRLSHNNTDKIELVKKINNPVSVIAAGSLAAGETIAAFTLAEVLIAMTVIG